ncbi:MAG TPA: hypothetical protein DEP84_24690 [Chloroflexi bacterium]|nr:hypothetical protein [Chloroflexota bacterium]
MPGLSDSGQPTAFYPHGAFSGHAAAGSCGPTVRGDSPGQPATLLTRLIRDCGGQDKILPVSGYRTLREQTRLFDESLRRNGREFTHQFVAFPNCSEHQTGLAIDLAENKPNIDLIRPDFPYATELGLEWRHTP